MRQLILAEDKILMAINPIRVGYCNGCVANSTPYCRCISDPDRQLEASGGPLVHYILKKLCVKSLSSESV